MDSNCFTEFSACAALVPCYNNGNAVMYVKPDGGTGLINKGIRSVIRSLEKGSSIDIVSFRNNYRQYVDRKKLLPVPVSIDTVMVPIRVRKAVSENDGAYAYINIVHLGEILGEKNALIRLKNGYEITALESADTVNKRFRMGYVIREKYCADVLNKNSMKYALIEINNEYQKNATKGDIALIIHELILLKNKIESYIK